VQSSADCWATVGWIAYVIAWLAATLFWTLASASSAGRSPIDALPFGLLAMGPAALMGVVVWRLTESVSWDWRARSFYAVHALAMTAYTLVCSTAWMWPDLLAGRQALQAWRTLKTMEAPKIFRGWSERTSASTN
jgi:hypothetical protein